MRTIINTLLFIIAIVYCTAPIAQPTNAKGWYEYKDLEGVSIGWLETFQYKTGVAEVKRNGWTYPANQTGFIQKTVTDWQKSYVPKAMLGDMVQSILAPTPPLPANNRSYEFIEAEREGLTALPNSYGAYARLHKCLVKNKTHKFYPMPGNWCYVTWNIMANNVELISKQMTYLSSADEYYCIQPRYTPGMKGTFEKEWLTNMTEYRDFDNSPNLKKYDHYLRPDLTTYIVVMTKDGKPLPFEKVTVGEFITRLETQLPRIHKINMNMGMKTANLLENSQRGIKIMKERYKNQWNEIVYLTDINKTIDCLDLAAIEEGKEITWMSTEEVKKSKSGWMETGFPVLRLKKGVKQACATSGPQWIICSISSAIDQAYGGSVDAMDNFVSRFNYEYLYNYYFGNKPSEPYKATSFVATDVKNNNQAATEMSETAKNMSADKSIIFFEDFSTVALNAAPPNWNTQKNQSGDGVAVTEIKGAPGKWLRLKNKATPKNIKLNVQEDFDFSFDLLVQKGDVPWGTPGIEVELPFATNNGDKTLSLNISPGNMNQKDAAGWLMLNFPGAGCKISSYYSMPDFKGYEAVNKATMTLRKKGNMITFLCNNTKVYECDTAFNPDMKLKGLTFAVNEKNVYYVSNIKIKKI